MSTQIKLLFTLLLCSNLSFAQKQQFHYVAHMPECPYDFQKVFLQNFHYPENTHDTINRAVVRFLILENGKIDSITILRPSNILLQKEIVKVISKMPSWKPGRNDDNIPIKTWYAMSVFIKP